MWTLADKVVFLLPVQFPGAHGAARRRAGVGAALPRTAGGFPATAGTGRSHLPHRQLEVFLPQLVQVGATPSLTDSWRSSCHSWYRYEPPPSQVMVKQRITVEQIFQYKRVERGLYSGVICSFTFLYAGCTAAGSYRVIWLDNRPTMSGDIEYNASWISPLYRCFSITGNKPLRL